MGLAGTLATAWGVTIASEAITISAPIARQPLSRGMVLSRIWLMTSERKTPQVNPYVPQAIPGEDDTEAFPRRCGPVASFLFAIGSMMMPAGLVILYDFSQRGWTASFGNRGIMLGVGLVAVSIGLLSLAFVRLQRSGRRKES